ncbi:MAG: protoporphyrinogen oxidase HemJ [Gammaproteobacteria bacterium]|nr:protoporphyrinogen oxidase HemJ [Gammaproteobacteria bacterium]
MLWIKAFHLIFVVCWFAGIFYLPRLFVYHAMTTDEVGKARFTVMEQKLYRIIMTPCAVLAVGFGIWLWVLSWTTLAQAGWLHAKLLLVALLIGFHLYCGRLITLFARDANPHNHIFFRWFNEAPLLILVSVVVLAVVRPF